jgi:hypothetical protein
MNGRIRAQRFFCGPTKSIHSIGYHPAGREQDIAGHASPCLTKQKLLTAEL